MAHRVAVIAYTWKAAAYASTPSHTGMTTTTFLKLGGYNVTHDSIPTDRNAATERAKRLAGKYILFVDEVGCVGQKHLHLMEEAVRSVCKPNPAEDAGLSGYVAGQHWGTLGVVLMGDLDQLDPVMASALHKVPTAKQVHAYQGYLVWHNMSLVFHLTEQHRYDLTTKGGQILHAMAKMWSSGRPAEPTYATMKGFCMHLNSLAILPGELEQLLPENPKFIVQRNKVRMFLNQRMAIKRANHINLRMMAWRAADTLMDNSLLTKEQEMVLMEIPPELTGNVGPMLMFFEGIEYIFADSEAQDMGRYRNGTAIGRSIVLDPREGPDPMDGPVWMLKYQPLAVYVEPAVDVGDYGNGMASMPRGCIPIEPKKVQNYHSKTAKPPTWSLLDGTTYEGFFFKRTGFPLAFGYAATDYFMQGASVGDATWLLHLRPPDTGKLSRASVLVCLTRFSDVKDIKLACPLWDPDASPKEIDDVSL